MKIKKKKHHDLDKIKQETSHVFNDLENTWKIGKHDWFNELTCPLMFQPIIITIDS